MHATKTDAHTITIHEPVVADVRVDFVERDGETFAHLNSDDLAALYDAMPHGASAMERGEIESYLCEVAEQ